MTGPGRLRAFVIDDLQQAHEAARDAGVRFAVKSAYRSFAQQAATFASLEKAYGRDFAEESAARPGHSEHQLGTTIDVDGGEAWLAANGWRYGFVQSYPVDRSPTWTCYKPEAWHFRYVGQPTARLVHASGMSLRGVAVGPPARRARRPVALTEWPDGATNHCPLKWRRSPARAAPAATLRHRVRPDAAP